MSEERQGLDEMGVGADIAAALAAESSARDTRMRAEDQARRRLELARLKAQTIEKAADARIGRAQAFTAALVAHRLKAILAGRQVATAVLAETAVDRGDLARAIQIVAARLTDVDIVSAAETGK